QAQDLVAVLRGKKRPGGRYGAGRVSRPGGRGGSGGGPWRRGRGRSRTPRPPGRLGAGRPPRSRGRGAPGRPRPGGWSGPGRGGAGPGTRRGTGRGVVLRGPWGTLPVPGPGFGNDGGTG